MPRGRPPSGPIETRTCARPGCGAIFEVHTANARTGSQRYCSRACSRQVANLSRSEEKRRAWEAAPESWCPCGKTQIPYEVRHTNKYCSEECRKFYAPKRQKDPANHVELICENPQCGKAFSRYRKLYIPGQRVFCSNECSAKVLKAVHHVVDLETSTVLDSGWEALFWGLCRFLKIPIERVDRSLAVEWDYECWYAPDFVLTPFGEKEPLYIEIKGLEDGDDPEKWNRWRELRGPIAVVTRRELDILRKLSTAQDVLHGVWDFCWLWEQEGIASVSKA